MVRLAALTAVVCVLLAACAAHPGSRLGSGTDSSARPLLTARDTGAAVPRRLPQAAVSASEKVPSALDDPRAKGQPTPLVNAA